MKKQAEEPKPIINLITPNQILAIIDGIEQSAFGIELTEEDGEPIAMLTSGDKEIFRVCLASRVILRRKESRLERVYTFTKRKWYQWFSTFHEDTRIWGFLSFAIKTQAELGGTEALTTNLITRQEVVLLIDAIRAMVFTVETFSLNTHLTTLSYESREVFRINAEDHTIAMTPLSGQSEIVYTFHDTPVEWFWGGTDFHLWKDLRSALDFYKATMHRVRMSDYRATFGAQMQKVIAGIAQTMEEAEAEVRMLQSVDKSEGGRNLHPEVARLVQKDLDAGEEAKGE